MRNRLGSHFGTLSFVAALGAALAPFSASEVRATGSEPELTATTTESDPLLESRADAPRSPFDFVVLVSLDGLRPDAIGEETPNLLRLIYQGTSARSASTIDRSTTLPSHASMVSGVLSERHGIEFNSRRKERGPIAVPTIFSGAASAGLPVSLFVGKEKLHHLLEDPADPAFHMSGIFCQRVLKDVLPALSTQERGLMFVHFADPDNAGHGYGWLSPEYSLLVRRADYCLGEIMKSLAASPHFNRTLLIATSDHGGHGRSHGSTRDADQRIPWLAWGGAVRPQRIDRPLRTMDTAATIFAALGLQLPDGLDGYPVFEALGQAGGPENMPLIGSPMNAPLAL